MTLRVVLVLATAAAINSTARGGVTVDAEGGSSWDCHWWALNNMGRVLTAAAAISIILMVAGGDGGDHRHCSYCGDGSGSSVVGCG